MPQLGTLDVAARGERAPRVTALPREPWASEGAEVLQLAFEIEQRHALEVIPPALHPAIPPFATFVVRSYPVSPIGAFRLAEVRVTGRAGVHYGGFVPGAFADGDGAVEWLRERYGAPVEAARIELRRQHHATTARVERGGTSVLEMALTRPIPIAGADVLVTASFHLAAVAGELRLVQVEPESAPELVERGRSELRAFDAAAFGDPRIRPTVPLPATYARGRAGIREVRYLIDPTRPAIAGTEKV